MNRSAAQTKEHVLQVAHDLFYWQGIRATGVDRIAATAGVAPTTLYRLFASKDDLIAEYVERAFEKSQGWITSAIEAAGDDPRAAILAVFDAQAEQIQPDVCRGCVFLMTMAEFPDEHLPGHRRSVDAKIWLRDVFRELTAKMNLPDPDAVADQLLIVIEGVQATAQSLGHTGPPRQARPLVEMILGPAA
jgi:AcrR family transcriptional regulator